LAENRAARDRYEIFARYEAGIVLKGSEVKSLRAGKADLRDAYADVRRGEAWIRQMFVSSFAAARAFPHEERGARKLLLHAREIREIERASDREGYTLLPLQLYLKGGRVKVMLGVARGLKVHDKRARLVERAARRDAELEVADLLRTKGHGSRRTGVGYKGSQ
jgi:SsrA-binding protein